MEPMQQIVTAPGAGDTCEKRAYRIMRKPEVLARTGKSSTQTWRDVRSGDFPAPIVIGPNSVGWFEHEIEDWIANRPRVPYAPDRAGDGNVVAETARAIDATIIACETDPDEESELDDDRAKARKGIVR